MRKKARSAPVLHAPGPRITSWAAALVAACLSLALLLAWGFWEFAVLILG